MREKPGFLGLRGAGCEPWQIAGQGGWRLSAVRTSLRSNIPCKQGIFQGIGGIGRLGDPTVQPDASDCSVLLPIPLSELAGNWIGFTGYY